MISGSSKNNTGARQTLLICLGLALATLAVYWRVHGFEFLEYDDHQIFFGNPKVRQGLTWDGIVWGATTCYYEYWHPLMWWSHMLDCQLFGMNAGPHHLASLAFHMANTLLVFAVFRRMTGMVWRSAIVAAFFGLHPLHVESVAWLAERKDLLSTSFWLLSVYAYARYAEELKVRGPRNKVFYSLALLMFLLGLLSKPMVVTLPFVLLLLDYWPLRRVSDFGFRISDLKTKGKNDTAACLVWEKWPFFALTVLFCFATWYSVKLGKNFPPESPGSPLVRWANIPVAYVRYLWMTIYPRDLAVLYPMPEHLPWWQVAGAIIILLTISWAVFRARPARYLLFGWFMFLGVLVPTIGVVQVGLQALADRYMYLPAIGLFSAAVWAVADVSKPWPYRTIILSAGAGALLFVCGVLSWIQVQYWHDTVSLWQHCLEAGHESVIAHHDLGHAYLDAGDERRGLEEYQAALKMAPDDAYANFGYGAALVGAGKSSEATNYLAKALLLEPGDADAREEMGLALVELGNYVDAISEFEEEIRLDPNRPGTYVDLGRAYSARGNSDQAVYNYTRALKLNPAYAGAHYYLGLEYIKRGALDEAVSSLEQAAEFDPATAAIHMQLAELYVRQHKTAGAVSEYRAILHLYPNLTEALNNLAWVLATTPDAQIRNGAEAVTLAERACEQTSWQQTRLIGTLGAAYAEAGDFEKAMQTAQKACDSATAHGEKDLLQPNQSLLEQYKNRQPFRDKN